MSDTNLSKKPKGWMALLEAIRKRPEMYIYQKSPQCLAAYIAGIKYVEPESFETDGFNWVEFEGFVKEIANPRELTFDSFTVALRLEPNEESAFTLWYSWYDKFKQRNT